MTIEKQIAEHLLSKKTIHIEMPTETHTELRVTLLRHANVSLQALFNEVAERIILGDNYMMDLIETLSQRKQKSRSKGFQETDVENIFDILEKRSPFGNK